jgi:hypothetical protein
MISRNVTMPELGLIAGTRVMVGAGIGLLLADQLKPEQKRAVGWTLLAIGLLTTIPLAADVLFGHEPSAPKESRPHDDALSTENDLVSSRS